MDILKWSHVTINLVLSILSAWDKGYVAAGIQSQVRASSRCFWHITCLWNSMVFHDNRWYKSSFPMGKDREIENNTEKKKMQIHSKIALPRLTLLPLLSKIKKSKKFIFHMFNHQRFTIVSLVKCILYNCSPGLWGRGNSGTMLVFLNLWLKKKYIVVSICSFVFFMIEHLESS